MGFRFFRWILIEAKHIRNMNHQLVSFRKLCVQCHVGWKEKSFRTRFFIPIDGPASLRSLNESIGTTSLQRIEWTFVVQPLTAAVISNQFRLRSKSYHNQHRIVFYAKLCWNKKTWIEKEMIGNGRNIKDLNFMGRLAMPFKYSREFRINTDDDTMLTSKHEIQNAG